jgi:hypothetical protein
MAKLMTKVPPPHRSPTAPVDRPWDWHGKDQTRKADEIIERGGWTEFAEAHAWYDASMDEEGNDPPREKQAYKLPHHEIVDGRLRVVWHGVRAAMQVLAGARGGVQIPESDRKKVYAHLAAHYKEFHEEPPPFEELSNTRS